MSDTLGSATVLCFVCWGRGVVMNRHRRGILRRWTFDIHPCPSCNGAGFTRQA